MLMIWCAGRGGTCARLTWDDTNRFITMGSPEDQKTHLKGEFQGINCLTWLTQVWETFHTAIKGPAERENRVVVSQGGGWNISACVTSAEVFLTKSRVGSRQSYGYWVSHPSNPNPCSFMLCLVLYMSRSDFTWPEVFRQDLPFFNPNSWYHTR